MSAARITDPGTGAAAAAVPAYQAADTIGDVVRRTLSQVPRVLVVDDGSSDDTGAVARAAGAEVLTVPRNRGKGYALNVAFGELFADGVDSVVTLDADGQHLPEEIPKLLAADGDLVLGTRTHLFADMCRLRRTSNSLSSRAISRAAGLPLLDVQTGFRRYGRRLIQAVGFPEARFEAESAVLVRAARRGFRVVGVPIELAFVDPRGKSHYRPLSDSLRIAWAVTRARLERL